VGSGWVPTGGGEQGPQGPPGQGVPDGGTTGQFLAKQSNDDGDAIWVDPPVVTGAVNGNAGFDGTGTLFAVPGYSFVPGKLNYGADSNITVVPEATTDYFKLHSTFAAANPIAVGSLENWIVKWSEAGIGTDDAGFELGDYTTGQGGLTLHGMSMFTRNKSNFGYMRTIDAPIDIGNGTDAVTGDSVTSVGASIFVRNLATVRQVQSLGLNINSDAGSSIQFANGVNVGGQIAAIVNNGNFNVFGAFTNVASMDGNYTVLASSPNITFEAGNSGFNGIGISGTLVYPASDGYYNGVNLNPTITGGQNATGIDINMSQALADNVRALNVTGDVFVNGSFSFSGALSIGQLNAFYAANVVDGGGNPSTLHSLVTSITASTGVTTANCDTIGVNTAALITLQANSISTSGPFGLGLTALALPCVVETHTGSTLDFMCAVTGALSLSGTSTAGGIIDEARVFRAAPISNGGLTTINKLKGYYFDQFAGVVGTDNWAFYGADAEHNWIEGGLKIGGVQDVSDKPTNLSVGVEFSTTKALVNTNVTTAERDALTALPGMTVFNVDTLTTQYYNGTIWI